MIICGNVFIFILTPILANVIERHYTFGGKELSCLCKMLGFQCFNTVVASTVYYFFADTFEPMRHSWYAFGAGMILNVLIGDLFVIGLGIDLARPGAIVCRHLATKATTQREMNHLYTEKADIYLAFRLQVRGAAPLPPPPPSAPFQPHD